MATIQSIIDRVTDITGDSGRVRWTLAEISRWLNEAAQLLAEASPRVSAQYRTLTLAAGSRQDLRTIDPTTSWVRLLELTSNVTSTGALGATIRMVSRPSLDAATPSWRSGPATALSVVEFALDEREPNTFDVNPPVRDGVRVLALAAVKPPACMALTSDGTALADPDEEFPMPPGLDTAAVDYVLYRCFLKNTNAPAYQARASAHLQAFQAVAGVEARDTAAAQ